MRWFLTALASVAVLGFACQFALAKEGEGDYEPARIRGTITAVDTTHRTIVLHIRKYGETPATNRVFIVTDATKITIDDETKTLADIKVGVRAIVTLADGTPNVAATIRVIGEE